MIHLKRLGYGLSLFGIAAIVVAFLMFLFWLSPWLFFSVIILLCSYCVGGAIEDMRNDH